MDIFDQATVFEERDREMALRMRNRVGPAETGKCLNCDAPMPTGRRWCDADCRDDWHRGIRAKNRR